MRQAAALSPEAQAERDERLRKRLFASRYRGLCGTCRRQPLRHARASECKECHAKAEAPRSRRYRRRLKREAEAEAKRLRALARERKRERANPAYFDWESAPDRTM